MEINNKYQFLISKYPLPIKRIFLYSEDVNDFIEGLHDTAVFLKETYLTDQSNDTIFGQMQLLEMELVALEEKLQQEANVEKQKDIKSKIEAKKKGKNVREQYLRKKTGSDYEDLYARNKKLIDRQYYNYQINQLNERAQKLIEIIENARANLSHWEEESNYHSHLSVGNYYIEEQEQELYDTINEAKEELEEIGNKINCLGVEK